MKLSFSSIWRVRDGSYSCELGELGEGGYFLDLTPIEAELLDVVESLQELLVGS